MDNQEAHVLIRGQVFLYKEKAPFILSGVSVKGAIEYDTVGDKLRCHQCGGWFKHLGNHVRLSHAVSVSDYKAAHGLRMGTALVSEGIRAASLRSAEAHIAGRGLGNADIHSLISRSAEVRRLRPKRGSLELANQNKTCHAQILETYRALSAKVGRTPTRGDCAAAGFSVHSAMYAVNVKTQAALASLAGMQPNNQGGQQVYATETLIEMMRDFYVAHGRLPSITDYRRGFFPHSSIYIGRFGSMSAAYEAAGLSEVAVKWRREMRLAAQANRGSYYSNDELIDALREFARSKRRIPRTSDCHRGGLPAVTCYRNAFGSFRRSLEAAGLKFTAEEVA